MHCLPTADSRLLFRVVKTNVVWVQWKVCSPGGTALTPLSQELCHVSVAEVHDLDHHGVDDARDEEEDPRPEAGALVVHWQRPTLHPEVDHHDVEGDVEAEQHEGHGHEIDAQLPLSVGIERLLAARHRVEAEDPVEPRARLFEGLLPAQRAPAIGQRGTEALPQLGGGEEEETFSSPQWDMLQIVGNLVHEVLDSWALRSGATWADA